MKNICVFCGSGEGKRKAYAEAARETGRALAESGYGLVYGGGDIGLMGILAGEAMSLGSRVTGVIPKLISDKVPHRTLTELHIVEDMHARKALMARLSRGFIALPGGIGTLEELFEMYTWSMLGYHSKPVALLNLEGYFDGMLNFLDHMVCEGFLKKAHRDALIVGTDPRAVLEAMEAYIPGSVSKW